MLFNLNSTIVKTNRRSFSLTKIFRHSVLNLKSNMSTQNNECPTNDGLDSKRVFVQRNSSNNMMTISFSYRNPATNLNSQFNLHRHANELLANSLERISLKFTKLNKRAHKKAKLEEKESVQVTAKIVVGDLVLDPEKSSNIDAWVEGAKLELDKVPYYVTTDSPQVEHIRLPNSIMQGFITVPIVSLVNCKLDNCKFGWFRRISKKERDQMISDDNSNEALITLEGSYWYRLCDKTFYCPTKDDIAHDLKVVCWPYDGQKWGNEASAISSTSVEMGPSEFPFEKRFSQTPTRLMDTEKFRVVSYNVLADLYADQDYSRDHLFAHCPPHALVFDYRRQLLLREIDGYNADIICLQEVDQKEFKRAFMPFFDIVRRYDGIFCRKGGQVAEGVATFYSKDKFELIDSHKTLIAELIESRGNIQSVLNDSSEDDKKTSLDEADLHFILHNRESAESERCLSKFDNIRMAILANNKLKRRFLSRHSVLQTTFLRLKEVRESYIIIANTHLYFAPDADHVRLLQGSCCVKYLEYLKDFHTRKLKEDNPQSNPRVGIVFCGDMNSTPDCGLYKLVTTGKVPENVPDWSSNEEEKVVGLSLKTDLRLTSSYKNLNYTNFTPLFNGCLDYIYLDDNVLECESTVPLPDHEDVIKTGGIPSNVFPSDHLALISNVKLKTSVDH